YDPRTDEPAVNALPASQTGQITFGCLNNFCKVSPATLTMWAEVLQRVDRSRLVLLAARGSHRQRTLDWLAACGISPERIGFVSFRPRNEYLQYYHDIDIGLDTLPYNGHTTSMDSFWMGVPVVSLAGHTAVGRAGSSLLHNLRLEELLAHTPEQF